MARLFVSQERLDRWSNEGKIALDGDIMTLPALGRSFRLRPAVYITRVVSDNADSHRLVGRVKTPEQLARIGADAYASSLILGEVAYECEQGFVGEVQGGQSAAITGSGIERLGH